MKPEYRYFRRANGQLYKVQTAKPDSALGNTYSSDGGDSWGRSTFHLKDMLSGEEFWGEEPHPVEYFPHIQQQGQPTYRFFRQGCGEWKVQTSDPESHEGNFYRNAETPWHSASHSLSDLLAMGATEVGASQEQVPRWAVAAVLTQRNGVMALQLGVHQADTEEQAVGLFMAAAYENSPDAQVQQPLIQRIP